MARHIVATGRTLPPHPTIEVVYYHREEWKPQADPKVRDLTDWDIVRKIEMESRDIDG